MTTLNKAYRFRMEPTTTQQGDLVRMAGARRWVWNWALRRWKDYYEAHGKSIGLSQLSRELTALKHQEETAWLKDVDSQALQQTLKDLHRAFQNFFARRARYPRFKSKKRDPLRFRIPQRVKINPGQIYIPKVGLVKIRQSQQVDETVKSATFRCAADGHWYVTLTTSFEMPDVGLPPVDPACTVGIDLGLKEFAVLSDGTREPSPRLFRKGQRKLRKAQRAASRRQVGSQRRAKAKQKVARVHQKITNQRGDFLHKLTSNLVKKYDVFCIEDLSLRGMARSKLAKSVMDAALGEFRRQLQYKCLWARKQLVVIDRWFPSSRLHAQCGFINDQLTLSDRIWTCSCGTVIDRDLNAATNIKTEGLKMLAVGQTESLNAQGQSVRPAKAGTIG